MMFTATVSGLSDTGHHILTDVQAENGMHRGHCWLGTEYRAHLSAHMTGMRVRISGQYQRYRPGEDGWTLTKIRSVEVIE
jgi:hypothetical protein